MNKQNRAFRYSSLLGLWIVIMLYTNSAAAQAEERGSPAVTRQFSPDLLLSGAVGLGLSHNGLQGSLIYRWQGRYVVHARVGKYYSGLKTFFSKKNFIATECALMPGLNIPLGSKHFYHSLGVGPALYAVSEKLSVAEVWEDQKWGIAAEFGLFWEYRNVRVGLSLSLTGSSAVNSMGLVFFHAGVNLLK